jgi:Large ribosomal RNA subunit accumulation protein YceD
MTGIDAWSWPVAWAVAQQGVSGLELTADAEALNCIAAALGLEGVQSLNARLGIDPWLDGVEVRGRIAAVVRRRCGVTLELFDEAIDDTFNSRFVPEGSRNRPRADEVIVDLNEDDPPEEVMGEAIDVGALIVETLALGLSPFPRMPGAVFEPPEESGSSSAFAALARLRRPPHEG